MIKTLKDALKLVETWPTEDQEQLAEHAREIVARRSGVYVMSDEERTAVRRGLAEADRGEFVPEEAVAEADKCHGFIRTRPARRARPATRRPIA
jgi:predicted transcriptional regulator